MSMDESNCVAFSLDTVQLEGARSEFLDNNESDENFSDGVDSMQEGSPSHTSDIAEDSVSSDEPSPDRRLPAWEMVDGKMAIAFFPDFIVYGDPEGNYTDFKVIFFYDCVRVSGSSAHGQGEYCIELAIEDIVDIRSLRCGRTEMVEVKIHVIARDSQQVLNLDGSSSVEELKFYVVDSLWHDKVEEIISLNLKYKALWNFMDDTDLAMDTETLLSQKILATQRKFIPEFTNDFEEVVYPKGDRDAVSVSMRDVDMLKPDTFINDTIIDFYITYLKNTIISPEDRPRFHFFNCFFFRKLFDMDKDPSSAFEGRAAFLRVRKWTRKVDLFSKEFVFIPVNYSLHWSLIVICHPGEIANISDEGAENLARVPCILHMDSLRGTHADLKDLIQSYLWEEWKERRRETDEAIASKFRNLRFVPLECLPQQENYYDCGLFLLHYLESFLEAGIKNFSPFMMKKSEIPIFLTSKWFLPDEPYMKRSKIMRLIHSLAYRHHLSNSSDQHCPSSNPKSNNTKENDFEVIGTGPSPSRNGNNQHMPISDGVVGIEMDLLQASFESVREVGSSELVLREFFDPVSSATLVPDVKHQSLGITPSFSECRNGLPSIEEKVEADVQFIQTSTEPVSQHSGANELETSALQYQSENYFNKMLSHEEHDNPCSSPANPECNSGSPIVADKCSVGVTSLGDHVDHPDHESAGNTESYVKSELTNLDDLMDHPNHESAENTEHLRKCDRPSGFTEDISGPHLIDRHDSADHSIPFLNNLTELALRNNETCVQEDGGITEDQHLPPAKKLRLMLSLEMDDSATNLSEDLHL